MFVGPHACFTNDKYPRAINPDGSLKGADDWQVAPITVRYGASLGANCTILPGVTVGRFALVGAGAVVSRDVPDHGLVVGNPARLVGRACACGRPMRQGSGEGRWDCPACGAVLQEEAGVRRGARGGGGEEAGGDRHGLRRHPGGGPVRRLRRLPGGGAAAAKREERLEDRGAQRRPFPVPAGGAGHGGADPAGGAREAHLPGERRLRGARRRRGGADRRADPRGARRPRAALREPAGGGPRAGGAPRAGDAGVRGEHGGPRHHGGAWWPRSWSRPAGCAPAPTSTSPSATSG